MKYGLQTQFYIFVLLSYSMVLGCSDCSTMKTIVGESENDLVSRWGQPQNVTGGEFEFFKDYIGGKTLVYDFEGKRVLVRIEAGKVESVSLSPAQRD